MPSLASTCSREALMPDRERGHVQLRESMPPLFSMVIDHRLLLLKSRHVNSHATRTYIIGGCEHLPYVGRRNRKMSKTDHTHVVSRKTAMMIQIPAERFAGCAAFAVTMSRCTQRKSTVSRIASQTPKRKIVSHVSCRRSGASQ